MIELADRISRMNSNLISELEQLNKEICNEYDKLVLCVTCEEVLNIDKSEEIAVIKETVNELKTQMNNTLKLIDYVSEAPVRNAIKERVHAILS